MANNENGYLLTEENISAIVSRVISNLIERDIIQPDKILELESRISQIETKILEIETK